MANSKNEVVYYDVANQKTYSGSSASIARQYTTKETVNLCMHEKKGMSLAVFFLLLAALFLVLILLEFFGVYRPYLALERKEAKLAEDRATLSQLYSGMSDRKQVQEDYRKYNYENFPASRVDREEVLDLLEEAVFDKGKITSFNITENSLVITVSEVMREDVDLIQKQIRESELVSLVVATITSGQEEELASVSLTVLFKDADKGGN